MAEILQFPNKATLIEGMESLAKAAGARNEFSNTQYTDTGGVAKVYNLSDYLNKTATEANSFKSQSGGVLSNTELATSETLNLGDIGSALDSNAIKQAKQQQIRWQQQTKLSSDGTKVEVIDKVDQYTDGKLDTYANTKPTIAGTISTALGIVGAGVMFGKIISKVFYEQNPDYWDSIGMGTMDPSTWADVLIEAPNGKPSFTDLAIMGLLQLDYEGKSAGEYISDEVMGLIARGLAKAGILTDYSISPTGIPESTIDVNSVTKAVSVNKQYTYNPLFKTLPRYELPPNKKVVFDFPEDPNAEKFTGHALRITNTSAVNTMYFTLFTYAGYVSVFSWIVGDVASSLQIGVNTGTIVDGEYSWNTLNNGTFTLNTAENWPAGADQDYVNFSKLSYGMFCKGLGNIVSPFTLDGVTAINDMAVLSDAGTVWMDMWAMSSSVLTAALNMIWNLTGSVIPSGMEGISNQDGATTLTNDEVTELASDDCTNDRAIEILKGRFTDLWKYRLETSTVQADGTTKKTTWVKIGNPNDITSNGEGIIDQNSDKGTAGSLQSKPEITFDPNVLNPNTTVDPGSDTAPSVLNSVLNAFNPNNNTESDPEGDPAGAPDPADDWDPPEDVTPPNPGTGITPPVVIPGGSAGRLFTVYRPTDAQLEAFGSWLWSDDFIDQLKKVFSDPMQSIIGLHKVFIPPLLGGSDTIHVGYLDSGVPSDVIKQQYSTVNCGSVDLGEFFGNVFDYGPYTRVQLYLPFIGIVDLDPADVMRSTITVKYTGDAYTGVCLATVYVKRDGNECALYNFTGNMAVQYPLSSGSYIGIVGSVLGLVGGIATATVNPLAGASTMASALLNARTKVQHSGNISGNSGAMGIKYPYLIITRPQTSTATNFPNFVGKPSNTLAKISQCSGFTRIEGCQVSNINEATQEEKTEIETILRTGFLA